MCGSRTLAKFIFCQVFENGTAYLGKRKKALSSKGWKVLKYRRITEARKFKILVYENIAEQDNVSKAVFHLKCCIITRVFFKMNIYTENVIFILPWWKKRLLSGRENI